MGQGVQKVSFVLGRTHSVTLAGLRRCADFWKDPPKDGRIECHVLASGALVLLSCSSKASAEIPAGEWQKL